MKRWRILFRIILGIYWLGIFVLTHMPPSKIPQTRVSDKLAHFAVFFGLGVLVWLALGPIKASVVLRAAVCLGIVLLYGAIDELTQPLVRRFCSLDDWLADSFGGATAVALMSMLHLLTHSRSGGTGYR